jgi:hypothetical protein
MAERLSNPSLRSRWLIRRLSDAFE